MRILHITAHLGGGVGVAFAGLGDCGFDQTVILLETPKNTYNVESVKDAGFRVLISPEREVLEEELTKADVCVFSWWHHPRMAELMANFPRIPINGVLWVHVSGNYFPVIRHEFLDLFCQVFFTSPYSMSLPDVKKMGDKWLVNRAGVVYGIGDIQKFAQIKRKKNDRFTVGYVGTLEFSKIHPRFVDFCAAVNIPEIRFLLAGTVSEELKRQINESVISDKVTFLGHVDDVAGVLSQLDVFGYPLNPHHFGATENSLVEAMAAGVPVIALDQAAESHIVKNKETGFLVKSTKEYADAMKYIFENPKHAEEIACRARQEVLSHYLPERNRALFISRSVLAAQEDKKIPNFRSVLGSSPSDWFLSATGENSAFFTENQVGSLGEIFHCKNKGTPKHYYTCFSEDKRLAQWASCLT